MTRRGFARLLTFAAPIGATLPPGSVRAAVPMPTAPDRSPEPDLKRQPPTRQVHSIALSGGTWRVLTADGRTRPFRESDLRFKTDQGSRGPRPGVPVILSAGMRGDRALVIFSRPEEFASVMKHAG